MDVTRRFSATLFVVFLAASTDSLIVSPSAGQSPSIQYDVPAVVTAQEVACDGGREVSLEFAVTSLIVQPGADSPDPAYPLDHMIVRCRFRETLPIVDFTPATALETDYSGPISVTRKKERSDSFGLSLSGAAHPIAGATFGADDVAKKSNSTEFQRLAPVQAVIAAGTLDRGRSVYFKYRWTSQQVLEGEKRIGLSVAVPESWRGGLLDVSVVAYARTEQVFGGDKLRVAASRNFVIAVAQQNDPVATDLAIRLAHLDQRLAGYAAQSPRSTNPITAIWKSLFDGDQEKTNWYRDLANDQADPYTDKRIRKLPMQVRTSILDYSKARRQLAELNRSSSS